MNVRNRVLVVSLWLSVIALSTWVGGTLAALVAGWHLPRHRRALLLAWEAAGVAPPGATGTSWCL